jgi:hypothetical protein
VRLIGVDNEVDVRGSLTLKRDADKEGMAILKILGGEVLLEATADGARRTGSLVPKNGVIKYDPKSLIVRWSQIDWEASLNWVSEDHLLFGTEEVRQLDVKSHYEAEVAR